MTDTTVLKTMLSNLINDKPEEASLDFHTYATAKMKEISGIGGDELVVAGEDTTDFETLDTE